MWSEEVEYWNNRLANELYSDEPVVRILTQRGTPWLKFYMDYKKDPGFGTNVPDGWVVTYDNDKLLPRWSRELSEEEVKTLTHNSEIEYLIKKDQFPAIEYALNKLIDLQFHISINYKSINYGNKDKDKIDLVHITDEKIKDETYSRYKLVLNGKLLDCLFSHCMFDRALNNVIKRVFYVENGEIMSSSPFKIGDVVETNLSIKKASKYWMITDTIFPHDSVGYWIYDAIPYESESIVYRTDGDRASVTEHDIELSQLHQRDKKLDEILDQ